MAWIPMKLEKDWRKTHWLSYSKIYMRFWRIKERCENKNNKRYNQYWWRWIKCEWKSFEEFYKDMWNTFEEWLTIDRIDVNWDYCKENCRWTDNVTQQNNRTNNHNITLNGITKTIAEWARDKWINYNTLSSRIYRWMDITKALNT